MNRQVYDGVYFEGEEVLGHKLVTKQLLDQLYENHAVYVRLMEAHRWLSEFDWLLEPMWAEVLRGEGGIGYCRTKMQIALQKKLKEQAK